MSARDEGQNGGCADGHGHAGAHAEHPGEHGAYGQSIHAYLSVAWPRS